MILWFICNTKSYKENLNNIQKTTSDDKSYQYSIQLIWHFKYVHIKLYKQCFDKYINHGFIL